MHCFYCVLVGCTLKPIFDCDAKTFALGPCVGLDPQCVTPNAKPQRHVHFFFGGVDFIRVGSRFSVEYRFKSTSMPLSGSGVSLLSTEGQ